MSDGRGSEPDALTVSHGTGRPVGEIHSRANIWGDRRSRRVPIGPSGLADAYQ